MKSNVFKFSTALIVLLFTAGTVVSQSFTKENTIVRSFALADDTEIEITNKYGDITLENWDKDSVRIEINYKVTSTKESKLNKTFDAINFNFKANQYYIVAATLFEGGGSFWTDVSDIANNMFSGGTRTSINYTIFVPSNRHISINLKYGNVYLTNHSGFFSLSLSNGDIKAHNLTGETELDVVFGDATINEISTGQVKISYGSLVVENADMLMLTGQSSEFELGIIDELKIDSKRDKIAIEEVNTVSGTTYFSRLTIDEIHNKIDLSTKYGSFKLKDISPGVTNVKLSSINTSASIYFKKDRDYTIKIISEDKTDISYSAGLGEFTTQKLEGKEKRMQAECIYGIKDQAVPVNINVKSGLLTLKLKE